MRKDSKRNRRELKPWTDLSDLVDCQKDRKCFVVGAGPSIAFLDLSYIHEHVVISVNSSILRMEWNDGEGISDRYWISNDTLCTKWSYFWTHVLRADCNKIVRVTWKKLDESLRGYGFRYFDARSSDKIDSEDHGLCSVSSVPTAIDLALLMGCREINLLGVDHCMIHGNSHFWQFTKIEDWPHRSDKGEKFRPDQKHQEGVFKKNMPIFKELKRHADEKGVKIYNCSKRSAITLFKKIPFEQSYV